MLKLYMHTTYSWCEGNGTKFQATMNEQMVSWPVENEWGKAMLNKWVSVDLLFGADFHVMLNLFQCILIITHPFSYQMFSKHHTNTPRVGVEYSNSCPFHTESNTNSYFWLKKHSMAPPHLTSLSSYSPTPQYWTPGHRFNIKWRKVLILLITFANTSQYCTVC